ncbi:MAG: organic solvent tolerance protein OstA [Bacteroidales bacterium]|nr:organic solvent tolerance protein OstA [Bacteroidales bacterium]
MPVQIKNINCQLFSSEYRVFVILIFLLFTSGYGNGQEPKKVNFTSSTMEVDKSLGNGAKRLLDNVVFEHEGAKMYCDSAYFYSEINTLDAFSNVYINQGDTLHLYGDFLNYNGNTRLAKMKRNVKLINKETTLLTDTLDFDLRENIGYYTHKANITNEDNHLTSEKGYYYTKTDIFFFKDDVIVTNPDYKIYSDTLKFNTETNIAYFFGPTEIISDSNYIYCESGWYNTDTDISELKKNAYIKNSGQEVFGDILYYERNTGFGRATNNVKIIDSEEDIILTGQYAETYEETEESILTGNALFIQINGGDSIFVHSDTLRSELDTAGNKLIRAYYKVKLFKSDMQGKCDSMAYSFQDSVIRLFHLPVLWSENHQLTAEYIEVKTRDNEVEQLYLQNSAFIVNQYDTSKYNQIKGKTMTCYVRDGQMYKVEVVGNGETVYYPVDEEGVIGVNIARSTDLNIYMNDGKVDKIYFYKNPDATLYPLDMAPENVLFLKGFIWLEKNRPKNKNDVFVWQEQN